jgi:3-oxoacid CoA-transferase
MQIHLPGIFVDRIVKATTPKEIEIETLAPEPGSDDKKALGSGEARKKREMIVKVRSCGPTRPVVSAPTSF